MTEWSVDADDEGLRLDAWLARRPEIGSRGRARDAIERGKVFLNGQELVFTDAGRRLAGGDRVGFWPDRPGSARVRSRDIAATRAALRIVYEDEDIVVVDKPAGWLVEPLPGEEGGEVTLRDLLTDHLRGRTRVRAYVVHRIDRDTSGLVLFALTPSTRDDLKVQFERRSPLREYLAVARGHVTPASGTWRDKLAWDKQRLIQKRAHLHEERAKDAVAHYRVLEHLATASVLEVRLVTGKRNQIRVQAGSRGYPLVGERIYTYGRREAEGGGRPFDSAHARLAQGRGEDGAPDIAFPRQALHAARLGFVHPRTGRHVEFTAPIPDDIRGLIDRLRAGRE